MKACNYLFAFVPITGKGYDLGQEGIGTVFLCGGEKLGCQGE